MVMSMSVTAPTAPHPLSSDVPVEGRAVFRGGREAMGTIHPGGAKL